MRFYLEVTGLFGYAGTWAAWTVWACSAVTG